MASRGDEGACRNPAAQDPTKMKDMDPYPTRLPAGHHGSRKGHSSWSKLHQVLSYSSMLCDVEMNNYMSHDDMYVYICICVCVCICICMCTYIYIYIYTYIYIYMCVCVIVCKQCICMIL